MTWIRGLPFSGLLAYLPHYFQREKEQMNPKSRTFTLADEVLLNGYQDQMEYIDDYDRHISSTELEVSQ